jgi:hypothetical protein
MTGDLPESDWRLFRQLREVTLERLCERALKEVAVAARDAARTNHERYLNVFRLLKERDRELADAFNDPRRSRMIRQLAAMHALRLLEPDELAGFTPRTRTTIEALAGTPAR